MKPIDRSIDSVWCLSTGLLCPEINVGQFGACMPGFYALRSMLDSLVHVYRASGHWHLVSVVHRILNGREIVHMDGGFGCRQELLHVGRPLG